MLVAWLNTVVTSESEGPASNNFCNFTKLPIRHSCPLHAATSQVCWVESRQDLNSQALFIHSSHNISDAQTKATLRMPSRKDCVKVWTILNVYCVLPLSTKAGFSHHLWVWPFFTAKLLHLTCQTSKFVSSIPPPSGWAQRPCDRNSFRPLVISIFWSLPKPHDLRWGLESRSTASSWGSAASLPKQSALLLMSNQSAGQYHVPSHPHSWTRSQNA